MSALLLLNHPGHERFDAMDRSPHVDIHDPLPVGMGIGLRWPEHRNAGIVEDDVNRTKTGPCLVREPFDRRFVGHISHDADRLRAVRFEPCQASLNRACSMSASTSLTPSRARDRAVASPMPLAPPVMTAVLPFSSRILLPFLIFFRYATS